MSDFHFHVDVLRDQMAGALADNVEQVAYVLAEFADRVAPGSRDFEEVAAHIPYLDEIQQTALLSFCAAICDLSSEEPADGEP